MPLRCCSRLRMTRSQLSRTRALWRMTASTWPAWTRTPSKISGWLTTSKRVCASGLRIEAGVDLKEARDGAEAGDDQLFAGDDGACGAQVGIDGEMWWWRRGGPGPQAGPAPAMRRCGGFSNPWFSCGKQSVVLSCPRSTRRHALMCRSQTRFAGLQYPSPRRAAVLQSPAVRWHAPPSEYLRTPL